jgi:hypothetical protein
MQFSFFSEIVLLMRYTRKLLLFSLLAVLIITKYPRIALLTL